MPLKLSPPAEDLAVRFVNTVAWRLKDPSEERLDSPEALLHWLQQNELISADQSRRMVSAWKVRPDAARATYNRAVHLREAIYALFLGVIDRRTPSAKAIAYLGEFSGLAREMIAVPMASQMAARPAEELASIAARAGLRASVAAGIEAALDEISETVLERPPRVLICGSLYLAGEVLRANGTPPA